MENISEANPGSVLSIRERSIRKVLVPTDFSACASHALGYALDLARLHGAEVQVFHVIDMIEGDVASPLRYSPEAAVLHETPQQMIYAHLEREIAEHDTVGIAIEPITKRGVSVASTVATYAEKEAVDLIVIGTHGRRGVKRLLLGSVAEQIVQKASCDVLLVAPKS